MPGRASNCSLVAELMSSRSASAGAAMAESALAGLAVLVCAVATVVRSATAKSENRIRVIRCLLFISLSLVLFGCFVAGGFGVRLAHEFSGLGFAIPASTLVVDPAVGVDPDHAARLGCCDLRIGRAGGGCGGLGARLGRNGRHGVCRGSL